MTTTILFDGDKVEQLHDLTDGPERLRGSMLLWVDLGDLSADSVGRVGDEFDLDEESRERLASSSGGTFFRDKGEYIHVTASAPRADADDETSEIECVVGDNWVVTAHAQPVAVLDEFAELARGSGRTGELDGLTFLAGLLTLASMIFLPGALVAGIMGMNFKVGLFEHAALFWVVVLVIALIGAVTLAVAKLRDWI